MLLHPFHRFFASRLRRHARLLRFGERMPQLGDLDPFQFGLPSQFGRDGFRALRSLRRLHHLIVEPPAKTRCGPPARNERSYESPDSGPRRQRGDVGHVAWFLTAMMRTVMRARRREEIGVKFFWSLRKTAWQVKTVTLFSSRQGRSHL